MLESFYKGFPFQALRPATFFKTPTQVFSCEYWQEHLF